jgi:type 1 glutamine amidotransferase
MSFRGTLLIVAVSIIAGCSGGSSSTAPGGVTQPTNPGSPIRVLMLTATRGFRHDSIAVAKDVMSGLATSSGAFTVSVTEDVTSITATTLSAYDVVFFALTTGELEFTPTQRSAIINFVSQGKGFLGVHSATDTLYEWADYGRLVGAYFKEHPWTQAAVVVVEDTSSLATTGLGDRFSINEEFYTFRDNPRPRVHVLLHLDAQSVGATGDYPLAWTQSFGSGRSYYNALGHFSETWRDPRFQRQLVGAIQWAAGR